MEKTPFHSQPIYHALQKLLTAHRNALQNATSTRDWDRGYQAGMSAVLNRVENLMIEVEANDESNS